MQIDKMHLQEYLCIDINEEITLNRYASWCKTDKATLQRYVSSCISAKLSIIKHLNTSGMRLKSISLSKLRQVELVSFVEDVLKMIGKHDLSALHIKDASEMLSLHYPQVIKLSKVYGRCLIAEKLRAVHIKRMEYAAFILTHALYLEKLKGESLEIDTINARMLTQLHFEGIRKDNRPIVNVRLRNFFNTIDNDEVIKDAFQKLGLLTYAEELRELDKRYNELYDLRSIAKAEISKRRENKGIQNKAEELLRLFFSQLKQAQQTYPDQEDEYAPLFAQLNRVIPRYTKLIRTRATLNKKRAAAKKAKAEAESKALIVCVDGKQTGIIALDKNKAKGEKDIEKKSIATTHKKGKRGRKKTVATRQVKIAVVNKDINLAKNKAAENNPIKAIKSTNITNTKSDLLLNGGQIKRKDDFDDGS